MTPVNHHSVDHKALFTLILSALLLQLIGHYFASKYLVFGSFYTLWPILRVVIPIIILMLLAIPLRTLSFQLPRFDKHSLVVIIVAVFGLCCMAFYLANFADAYLAYYRKGVTLEYFQLTQRFERFMVFTVSTVIAWEIFHRGFLLGGLRFVLVQKMAIEQRSADVIAMLFLSVFEALFHIKKPMVESIPLMFASLILSWLTIRTGSLWPALIIHFMIEVIFGYSAYIGW